MPASMRTVHRTVISCGMMHKNALITGLNPAMRVHIRIAYIQSYSLLSAMTGSFLDATLAGIRPATSVRRTLIAINMTAPCHGSEATPEIPVSCLMTILIGISRSNVMRIPSEPDTRPTIIVSALNTLETSRLEAPILLNIPISLVLSRTDI